jgi:hypothetical protein
MKILLLLLIPIFTVNCQDFGKLNIIASLPNSMKEVSGIDVVEGSDLIWMVDDRGNSPTLYGFNKDTESFDRQITLTNANNEDWEDVTSDADGNLFIGDFGNNRNDRKDLTIYTVRNITSIMSNKAEVTQTRFYLEDQDKFPPKKKDRNFDIESFFYLNNHFYLFTRNRSKDFDGTTKLYKLPAKEGDFEAKLISSFKTCNDKKDCEVTSAAIHHKTGTVVLLTYDKVFIFTAYSGDSFFEGNVEKIKLDHYSQKESVTFKNENTLYIADERNDGFGGNLYELSIKN